MKMFKIIFTVITFIVLTIQSMAIQLTTSKIVNKLYDKIYECTGDEVKAAVVTFVFGGIVLVPAWAVISFINGKLLKKIYDHFSA